MLRRRINLFPVLLFLAYAGSVSADSDTAPRTVANVAAQELEQMVYKGVVGNVLDGIPMDASKRVSLQRTNAIISNTLSGRSLAMWAGLSNPVLLLGGFVWGVWAASNIKPGEDGIKSNSDNSQADADIAALRDPVALLVSSPATNGVTFKYSPETAQAKSNSASDSHEPSRVRAPVVKIWLPQRSSGIAVAH